MNYTSKYSTSYYQVPSPIHEKLFSEPLERHTHLTGAVRTGKTRLAITRFVQDIFLQYKTEPHITKNYCIIAKSRASLLFNILKNLYDWLPFSVAKFFPTSQNSSGFSCMNGKINIRYFPVDDERSVSRLMGSSLQGVLLDEVVYISHNTYAKITSRLTGIINSRFQPYILTTSNPDSVSHWLNLTHILPAERKEISGVKVLRFQLNKETCPFLPDDTINQLINDYKDIPALYKRYILGIWCSAGGAVFASLCEEHVAPDSMLRFCQQFVIGIDFGYIAPTACVLIGILPQTYFSVTRCVIISDAQFSTSNIATTSSEYRANIIKELIGDRNVSCAVYDSANPEQAASLDHALRERGIYLSFYPADKCIKESVELLLLSISSKRLLFSTQSQKTFNCFCQLEYDEKDRDKIVVKQSDDHLFDAVRYACMYPLIKNKLKGKL